MGGVESMKVSVLAGAEQERMELEKLLIQRAKFTGDVESLSDMNAAEEGLKGGLRLILCYICICRIFFVINVVCYLCSKAARPKKTVIGFGKDYAKLYGLGEKFDENAEFYSKNSRFYKDIYD